MGCGGWGQVVDGTLGGEAGEGRELRLPAPRPGAKTRLGWHSEEAESGFRLCYREKLGRVSQKQMGHHSQPCCSPFLCQLIIEENHFLLPGRAIHHPVLIVSRSHSQRGEGLTFTELWLYAGRWLDY